MLKRVFLLLSLLIFFSVSVVSAQEYPPEIPREEKYEAQVIKILVVWTDKYNFITLNVI